MIYKISDRCKGYAWFSVGRLHMGGFVPPPPNSIAFSGGHEAYCIKAD